MTLPVFILETAAGVGDTVLLSGAEGRHAVTVKRISEGEKISLIDGRGTARTCTVTAVLAKDQLEAVIDKVMRLKEPDPVVTIVQAVPKSERSELTIDLLTQAGADRIVPWQATRSVAKWSGKEAKSIAKWRAAALAAAKQARRATIPEVLDIVEQSGVEKLIAEADLAIILHEEASLSIRDMEFSGQVVVIIGPEGGIAPAEYAAFTDLGAHGVKLGPEVLRTASAGMVALAAIGVLSQRW